MTNLAEHAFVRIAAQIPGYPAPDAPALDWEAMRWGAAAFKQAFDEVYLDYGRSLKPDLIVATWNHLGDMGYRDERAFTPLDQWGRGEHYFWYSGGYGPTQLANRKLGDGWVNCLFLREMGGGKPFMLGKYEPIRVRNSIAEALATGGSGMGLYMPLDDPAGTAALARMLRFPREHAALYATSLVPDADVLLVYPREAIQAGNRAAAEAFRDLGRALSERHIIFEVGVDGRLDPARLARSRAVLVPAPAQTDADLRARLAPLGTADPTRLYAATNDLPHWVEATQSNRFWRLEAPWTVKAMAWRGRGRRLLHLVNYDRDEEAAAALPKKPVAECPRPVTNLTCRVALAAGGRVSRIHVHTPEQRRPVRVRFTREAGAVAFQVPSFPVYGVVEIRGDFADD